MLGFPPGFWAGVLGFAVAAATSHAAPRGEAVARPCPSRRPHDAPGNPSLADAPRSAPEIRALIAAFNRLGERIADLLKARMALVGGISHDLRTYATRLRLRAEIIADASERAKAVRDLDDMQRLLDNSLLAIEPRRAPHPGAVDIAPILEREAEDRKLAGAASRSACQPARRGADPRRLPGVRRLIANLTDNAITYGGEAGSPPTSRASAARHHR